MSEVLQGARVAYRLREIREQVGAMVVPMVLIASIDEALDDLVKLGDRGVDAAEILRLTPYFGTLWPSGRGLARWLTRLYGSQPGCLSGQVVLELGCGLALPSLVAARLGARVIATTGSPAKLEALQAACQPDAAILAEGRFREAVAEITGGHLCDLVYDPVGGDIFDESTRCVAFGGKLLVIGFAGGRIAEISTNIPLIKGFSVVGVRAGEYARRFPERGAAVRQAVLALAAEGKLHPHIDRVLPLERWREAFDAMAGRGIVGKVVLEP